MKQSEIKSLIIKQREFFATGETKDIKFRISQLKKLKAMILDNDKKIVSALYKDLRKSEFEAYTAEISMAIWEINHTLKKIKKWARPTRGKIPITFHPAKGKIYKEPYGNALIIAPWNYPFLLAINPIVGAIAAGNTVILKPSEISENTSKLLAELIAATFPPEYITTVEGGIPESQALLSEKFDIIFYTGNTVVGKIVMKAAAEYLTPTILELGGKNPCIITRSADLKTTARRIVWGKFYNAGQTCVAPDYLLIHSSVKDKLTEALRKEITGIYGDNPAKYSDYPRIINNRHLTRLTGLIKDSDIILGGESDPEDNYLAPTLVDNVAWDSELMKDEIFGPILPIIEYDDLDTVIKLINERPKPLALYLFSRNKKTQQKIIRETSSGGGCINDIMIHLTSTELPFGGVGDSGMGNYHGKASFEAFSHHRSVVNKPYFFDIRTRYLPTPKLTKTLKSILNKIS